MGRVETLPANSNTSWEAPSALVLTHSRGQGVGESEHALRRIPEGNGWGK
jgi:hypothetical protein